MTKIKELLIKLRKEYKRLVEFEDGKPQKIHKIKKQIEEIEESIK